MIKLYDSTIEQILPANKREIPEIQALSYAQHKAVQWVMEKISQTMIYAGIDDLPEKVLDVLAVEFRSPYYEPDMDLQLKRTIVKNTLCLYTQSGTPAAVEEMIKYIFQSGELEEWFENGGTPGTFEIRTTAQSTEDAFVKFTKMIKKVKNVRSHLVKINFGSSTEAEQYAATGLIMAKITTIL